MILHLLWLKHYQSSNHQWHWCFQEQDISMITVQSLKYYNYPFMGKYRSHGSIWLMSPIDVIISAMASQITNLTIVFSTVYSGADQRKYQSSASLASVRGIHRWPMNSPHKGPVTRKMFPFDDVIMKIAYCSLITGLRLYSIMIIGLIPSWHIF